MSAERLAKMIDDLEILVKKYKALGAQADKSFDSAAMNYYKGLAEAYENTLITLCGIHGN